MRQKHQGESGEVLKYLPDNLLTTEFCLIAVKSRGRALQYVPENLKTPEMCLEAVKQNDIKRNIYGKTY